MECIFCNLQSSTDEILWETNNFFVKVGIGIFSPGHVMIISKKHLSCFGELPKELYKEFVVLKGEVG